MKAKEDSNSGQPRGTLFWRLISLFSLSVVAVWTILLAWIVIVALKDGAREVRVELDTYSQQILPVAVALRDAPEKISAIFLNLELLEDQIEDDAPDDFFIDVEIDGRRIYQGAQGFTSPELSPGYQEYEQEGDVWWSHTSADESGQVLTRVTFRGLTPASINVPSQLAVFFLPLIVSLPLLLIPAWFMARIGLRPLERTAGLINERVENHSLEALPGSRYKELDSVTVALNQLLARLREQLQRERDFVAEVAHELKTPLAIVQTNQGILKTTTDSKRRAVALDDLNAGVLRCNHLVQQLLGLARLEKQLSITGRSREVDIAEFVRLRLAHAEVLATERRIALDLNAPDSLVTVLDVDAFAAAFDNLLDNAIKYSPPGGSVQVEMEFDAGDVPLLLVTVLDHGPGILPALREKAFERFKRLGAKDQQYEVEGAGLGLTIVRRAVKRLNGRIELDMPDVRSTATGTNHSGETGLPVNSGLRVRLQIPLYSPDVGK